ncbi:unnamed protein product [Ectocarpus sp. 12 AP-2014]
MMDDAALFCQHEDAQQKSSQAGSIADSLPMMMYGFGDEQHPLPETVAYMQEVVGEYVQYVTDKACKAAEVKGKLDTECFVLAVRNDKAKFKRVKELLDLNVHIKNCTRQRYVDDNLTVYHPTFVTRPKVRAIVPLNRLSATALAEPSLPPPPPSSSAAPPVSSSATLVATPPVLPSPSASAVASGASDGIAR